MSIAETNISQKLIIASELGLIMSLGIIIKPRFKQMKRHQKKKITRQIIKLKQLCQQQIYNYSKLNNLEQYRVHKALTILGTETQIGSPDCELETLLSFLLALIADADMKYNPELNTILLDLMRLFYKADTNPAKSLNNLEQMWATAKQSVEKWHKIKFEYLT